MRFCRYQLPDQPVRIGIAVEDRIVPLQDIDATLPNNIDALLAMEPAAIADLASRCDLPGVQADVNILAPIAAPEKIVCVGLNYRDHAIETGAEIPTEPVIFNKFPSALVGPDQPIVLPSESNRVDYEAELVVVIGKQARHVSEDEAMEYVFGYCCGNDVSARDWQKGTPGGQWLLGKTFDSFAPLGPYLVHKSAVPDPGNLRVQLRLNGQTMQDSTTQQLIFSIPKVIAHISKVVTLRPGDVIYTGTPPGVGDARTPPVYLSAGDVCEVEIEGLGTLRNPCV